STEACRTFYTIAFSSITTMQSYEILRVRSRNARDSKAEPACRDFILRKMCRHLGGVIFRRASQRWTGPDAYSRGEAYFIHTGASLATSPSRARLHFGRASRACDFPQARVRLAADMAAAGSVDWLGKALTIWRCASVRFNSSDAFT